MQTCGNNHDTGISARGETAAPVRGDGNSWLIFGRKHSQSHTAGTRDTGTDGYIWVYSENSVWEGDALQDEGNVHCASDKRLVSFIRREEFLVRKR